MVDEDRYDLVRRLLVGIDSMLSTPASFAMLEVNGIKPLFGAFLGRAQPWTLDDARAFIAVAWARMEA